MLQTAVYTTHILQVTSHAYTQLARFRAPGCTRMLPEHSGRKLGYLLVVLIDIMANCRILGGETKDYGLSCIAP
jgi:hypothetical protein